MAKVKTPKKISLGASSEFFSQFFPFENDPPIPNWKVKRAALLQWVGYAMPSGWSMRHFVFSSTEIPSMEKAHFIIGLGHTQPTKKRSRTQPTPPYPLSMSRRNDIKADHCICCNSVNKTVFYFEEYLTVSLPVLNSNHLWFGAWDDTRLSSSAVSAWLPSQRWW